MQYHKSNAYTNKTLNNAAENQILSLLRRRGCDCLMLYDTVLVGYKLSSVCKDMIFLRNDGDTDGHPHWVKGPRVRIRFKATTFCLGNCLAIYFRVTKVSILQYSTFLALIPL